MNKVGEIILRKLKKTNKKQNTQEKDNIKGGFFCEKDYIAPAYIDVTNPKYIEVDGIYHSLLLVVNYNREQVDLILKPLIDRNININISMFYEKKDTYKAIKELTYHIGNVGVDLENINKNRQDIDIAAFTYNDAKYIRREIQVNNEELYFLYLYLDIFSFDKKNLEYVLNKVEGIAQSNGLQTRRAYFRQEQTFLACMPIMDNNSDIKDIVKRNVLTSSLVSTYPFISSTIFDEEGIFIGTNIYNNSLVFVDRYNTNKYKNANICIFGTSGSGKSFYTKLLILRNRLLGIEQYIIDPDREYGNVCKELEGTLLKIGPSSKTYINVLDIREESIEENKNGYLATKIGKLIGFFNMVFGEMDEEEKAIVEEKIIECYKEKGITFDDSTLYKYNEEKINIKPRFKESIDMPILEDLYRIMEKDYRTTNFKTKLIPFIKGSLRFLNNHTNVELNSKTIVADVYELGEENLKYGMYIFTELFWDKIKINRNVKKAIYLDEIWRLIGVTSNKEVASFIYKIFKTIRKYGGSSVAITQDVSDLFSLEDGIYGKSILNNSSIKTFFSLEEENIKILSEYTNLSEKEKIEIKSLKRGECLMFVGNEHILAKIDCSNAERKIIDGGDFDEKSNNSNCKSNFK